MSRPDVVATWNDSEVARRWLLLSTRNLRWSVAQTLADDHARESLYSPNIPCKRNSRNTKMPCSLSFLSQEAATLCIQVPDV